MTRTPHTIAFALAIPVLYALLATSAAQERQSADPTQPAPQWLAALAPAPVNPADTALPDAAQMAVRVVVLGKQRRFAVVDGQRLELGQTYRGAKLLALNAQGVKLRKDGAAIDLQLAPRVKKTPPQSTRGCSAPVPATPVFDGAPP